MADCLDCGGGAPVVSYGTVLGILDPRSAEWVTACGVTDLTGPSASRSEIDTTNLCSKAKEFVFDLPDWGTVEVSAQWLFGNAGQELLFYLFTTGKTTAFRIKFPDDGYGNGPVTLTFEAGVTAAPVTAAQGAVITVSFTLRITGEVQWTNPDPIGPRIEHGPLIMTFDKDGALPGVVTFIVEGDTFAVPAGTEFSPNDSYSVAGVDDLIGMTPHLHRINENTAIFSVSGTSNNGGNATTFSLTFYDPAFSRNKAEDILNSENIAITVNEYVPV